MAEPYIKLFDYIRAKGPVFLIFRLRECAAQYRGDVQN